MEMPGSPIRILMPPYPASTRTHFARGLLNFYVKITMEPATSLAMVRLSKVIEMAGRDPDYHTRTLFNKVAHCQGGRFSLGD